MPLTAEEVKQAVLLAMLDRASRGEDEDGSLDSETQEDVEKIAAWAEGPGLAELLAGDEPVRPSPAQQMSLDGAAPTDPAERLVDEIVKRGASVGVTIADEIRRKVRALAKKRFPSPS